MPDQLVRPPTRHRSSSASSASGSHLIHFISNQTYCISSDGITESPLHKPMPPVSCPPPRSVQRRLVDVGREGRGCGHVVSGGKQPFAIRRPAIGVMAELRSNIGATNVGHPRELSNQRQAGAQDAARANFRSVLLPSGGKLFVFSFFLSVFFCFFSDTGLTTHKDVESGLPTTSMLVSGIPVSYFLK